MGHIREYTPREVRRLLAVTGLSIDTHTFRSYPFPPGVRGRLLRLLDPVLPSHLRTWQVIVARKAARAAPLEPLGY